MSASSCDHLPLFGRSRESRQTRGEQPAPQPRLGQETTLVAERPGPPVAVTVSLSCAPRGPPHHLRLLGALLGAVHSARKGGGHPPGVGHRVDPPGLTPTRGARHRVAHVGERAPLLERSAILTDKFVDRHLVSPLPSAVARPQICAGRFNHNHSFRAERGFCNVSTMTSRFVLT